MNENKKFPLGFWNYHALGSDVQKPEEAKRWAECGMTLTLSPTFCYKSNTVQEMIDMLDACHENGIRLIIVISELHYLEAKNEETYRAAVKRAYDDFGNHPATFGFFVADEPANSQKFQKDAGYNYENSSQLPQVHLVGHEFSSVEQWKGRQ